MAKSLDDVAENLAKKKADAAKGKAKPTTATPAEATPPAETLTDDQTFGWDVWLAQLRECTTQSRLDALGIPKVFSAAQEAAAMKLISAQSSTLKG